MLRSDKGGILPQPFVEDLPVSRVESSRMDWNRVKWIGLDCIDFLCRDNVGIIVFVFPDVSGRLQFICLLLLE